MKLYTIKHPDGTIFFDMVSPSIFDPWAMLLRARNGLDEEWLRVRAGRSFVSFARDSGYKLVRIEIVEREEEPDPKDWSQRDPE